MKHSYLSAENMIYVDQKRGEESAIVLNHLKSESTSALSKICMDQNEQYNPLNWLEFIALGIGQNLKLQKSFILHMNTNSSTVSQSDELYWKYVKTLSVSKVFFLVDLWMQNPLQFNAKMIYTNLTIVHCYIILSSCGESVNLIFKANAGCTGCSRPTLSADHQIQILTLISWTKRFFLHFN